MKTKGSKTTSTPGAINPYRQLSLRVILQAIDDKDKWWLRRMTRELKFWLDCAGIDHLIFQKEMALQFPDMSRKSKKPSKDTKFYRNMAIIGYHKAYPKLKQRIIGKFFGISAGMVSHILVRGY